MNLESIWLSQYDFINVPHAGPSACFRACREMARRGWGVDFPESTETRIQLADGELDHGDIVPNLGGFVLAQEVFGFRLKMGLPVIVGINYKAGSQNRDGITDHFNLVCGFGDGGIIIGLNPGAEMHGKPFNAAFMEDAAGHCYRAVKPDGLRACISMVVCPVGWKP